MFILDMYNSDFYFNLIYGESIEQPETLDVGLVSIL